MYSGRLQPILHVNLDIIENIKGIPDNIQTILTNAIAFLIAICFAMGVILAIVGAIQWATGWDDRGGKKTVVKG
ncbi:MAG: hypothetical protein KAJ76_02090, partial [Candidatus Heimdallarchaeota archaeon]|nr:hypothetical protein [Candidatus Heimdallarchaeota archaeon]